MSRCPRFLGALGLVALAPSASAQLLATETIDPAGSSHVRVATLGEAGEPVRAFVELNGVRAFLDLVPHQVRSETFRLLEQLDDGSIVEVPAGPVTTYRGTIIGSPGSEVAATVGEDGFYARITLADGREQWVQPLTPEEQYVPGADHIVYSTESVIVPYNRCGAEDLPGNVQKVIPEPDGAAGGPQILAPQAIEIAELACDADYEYFQKYGSSNAVRNRIELIINSMNLQYERDVDITHSIGTILVRTSANQPYTSSDSGTLLNQFRNEWENNQGSIVRDVAELFTGKNLNGSVIGIAWLGGICNSFGYNVVEADFSSAISCSTDLSAHELGHNWNADHCSCPRKTMNPSITCENEFSTNKTVPDIVGFRNSLNCLQPGFLTETYFDDFESNTWTSGNWILGNTKPRLRAKAAFNGLFGARLRNTTWIETTVDTTGLNTVRLSYARRSKNFESGEVVMSEWHDGNGWVMLEQTATTVFSQVTFNLGPSAANNPALRIRFRTIASQNKERGDVDDVRISGF